jgi:hypothetical protein
MKPAFTLLFILIIVFCNARRNPIGFLKPGRKIIIKDIETEWQKDAQLPANIYFEILSADSSIFKIAAFVPSPCVDTAFQPPCTGYYTSFVDSSFIVQFDSLSKAEKRMRIEQALNYYIAVLKAKPLNVAKAELADVTVYEPMRGEFVRYWLLWRDEELLGKWLTLLYSDDGSADEVQGWIVAKLFCEGTDDFVKVFAQQTKKLKDYILYRLEDTGFKYYAAYDFPLDGLTEDRIDGFIKLSNNKLGPLVK